MGSRPRSAGPTFTTRGIAVAVHCLRRSRFVRELSAARSWLDSPEVEADIIHRLPGHERHLLPWLRLPPVRAAFLGSLDLRVPGTSRHLLARKLWFYQQACEFLATEEPRQVLILGAGLDGLGIRLATDHAQARIFECDRPEPMRLKRELPGTAKRPHYLARDLAMESRLEGMTPDRPTLILAEGLLMYLHAKRVKALLAECAQSLRGKTQLAFSYLDMDSLADPTSPIARLGRALAHRGEPEPFRWSTTPTTLRDFLAEIGFTLEATLGSQALGIRTLGRKTGRRAYGESVATARRA